jgi:hypothetical protein
VQAANSGITISTATYGKTITVNNASDMVVTLPSVGSVGAVVTVVKLGAGRVTVDAPAGIYIGVSSSGGTIYSTNVSPNYASVTLRQVTATYWAVISSYGTWSAT